jgi:hypothetical protein
MNKQKATKKKLKPKDISNVKARYVIFFRLKDGKYRDVGGNEITTEMLMKHPHEINGNEGIIWLP